MNNNKNLILFGSIEIESKETLLKLIETLDDNTALFLLGESVKYSHKNGLFSLVESELLSKSLRLLEKFNKKNEEN